MTQQTGGFFATDIKPGILDFYSWKSMALRDIKTAYRRSYLGIVWISLSTIITLLALSFVYSYLFPVTLSEYLPFLAVSYVTWIYISMSLGSSCHVFIAKHIYIKQRPIPLTVFMLSNIGMNSFIFVNNLVVALFFVFFIGSGFSWTMLILPISFIILTVTSFAMTMILGVLTCRFRDVGQIINSITQLAFFVTPILWKPEFLSGRFMIAFANPFYHYIELIRAPIIDHKIPYSSLGITLILTTIMLVCGYLIISKKRNVIPFWV
jgi:lipopolysaccharide transport system permease protein